MDKLRTFLLNLPRRQKRLIQIATDILLVWASLWLAFIVRLGLDDMYNPLRVHFWLFACAPVIAIPLFIRFGMYRAVMRYFGNDALIAIIKAVSLSSLILALVVYWYSNHETVVPRSIIFNYWWLSLVIIGGLRLCMRQYFMGDWFNAAQHVPFTSRDDGLTKVAVYGAGVAGNQLVAALRMGRVMRPVAFIDDDPSIADRSISGLHVYKPKHIQQMIDVTGAQEILLALPSSTRARRREILNLLEGFPLHIRSVPNFTDLASGRVKVDDIQEVDIADLLGRDAVPAQAELLERCIKGKTVMVTGAGGSIGSELCKHVPMVEHNIAEGVLNNVIGTLNTAQAALQSGVSNFVLISTDKAVRPTNVMGSTKRLAEMTLQALSREVAPVLFGDKANVSRVNKTRFTMVRFGNVLGSSGSVIPLFHSQIKSGGPLTVTHPKITRYFMTIPESAQLVIQAGSMGQGGDVFVLDMGEPVKIVELAEKMIHLSGLSIRSERNPQGDISIQFTGLRPGEKLYEELLIGDNVAATPHPMIMTANEDHLPWDVLKAKLSELLNAVEQDDYSRVRQLLRETVSGYTPDGEIVDWIYQQRRLEP